MDTGVGEALVIIAGVIALVSLLVFAVRYQTRKNADPLLGSRSKVLSGVPEAASLERPRMLVAVVTSKPGHESDSVSTPTAVPVLTQVYPQQTEEEVSQDMPDQEEVTYDHKTCNVFCGSDVPMLEFGSISDISIDNDGLVHAVSQPTDKGLSLKLGSQDVLIAKDDIVDQDFDEEQSLTDQYDSVNRVRIWSNNVVVFDNIIGNFDPSGFDTKSIDGLLEDGTSIWIAVGIDTRVLFQEV